MDPPERWSAADKYGMTPYEQAHPRDLDERLAEEEPDVQDMAYTRDGAGEPHCEQSDELAEPHAAGDLLADDAVLDAEVMRESIDRGQLADDAGGSVASVVRTPDAPPDDDATADDAEPTPQ
jgi:hypothetical protein